MRAANPWLSSRIAGAPLSFDPQAATATYIDSLGADALAKAAAYTTGGHWLLLWNLLVTAVITWLFVRTGLLDRISAKLGRRGLNLKAWVIAAVYIVVSGLISLPWTIYTDWWRERGYGRTSQPLVDYLGQGVLSLLIAAVFVALFFVGVYALMRRAGRFWWVWSGGLTAFALSLFLLAGPVFIEPLFNDYKPVPAGEVRDALRRDGEAGWRTRRPHLRLRRFTPVEQLHRQCVGSLPARRASPFPTSPSRAHRSMK